MVKLWYGSSMRPYPEDEPPFFDNKVIPWAVLFEQHWPAIKEELGKLIAEKDKSFEKIPVEYEKIATKGTCSQLRFSFWGLKFSNGLKKCPTLNATIKQIPGVASIILSRLEPNTDIPGHFGDTNGIYRCHLGVEIPAGLPECGIKVGGVEKDWEEGKFIVFNDAHFHTAWNHTKKRRIVLIIDTIRPEFLHKKNLICAFVLTRYASFFYDRIKLISIMPVPIKTVLFAGILALIYVFKPVYNLFKG